MTYSDHRKLLYVNYQNYQNYAFNLLGYETNTNASILVYKFCSKRTGFNMYEEHTQLQLTFLANYILEFTSVLQ